MVNTVAYAYPWDVVGDPGAAERIAGLGVDAVALAASYHTVRAATPLHPAHRVVDARHAALYLPVREEAWRGRLAPAAPAWMDGPDPFGAAASALRAAGLPVYAWTVLTHSSLLGATHSELSVRNAFGDRYPYALCPANADVVEYCVTLVREIVQIGRPDGMVLEACGPLGLVHGGHHEKTDGADWTPTQQRLLSLCCCAGCAARYADAGIDVERLRAAVRSGVDAAAPDVGTALGEPLAAAVSAVRTGLAAELRRLVVGEIRTLAPDTRVILHASADPWATGPFATVAPAVDAEVDALIGTCWPGPERSLPGLRALRDLAGPDTGLGGYVLALPPRPADGAELLAEMRRYAEAGVTEFHLYHAGLASAARLAALREAVAGITGALVG
jgi:hypothetical protein